MIFLTKPLSLIKLVCFFGMRTTYLVMQTWTELLRAAMGFHASLLWRMIIWCIAILSLPVRVLTALQRERALEMHLQQMQTELENLVWVRKELEKQLRVAIKEQKLMQVMLAELDDEHDEAIVKIEQLEGELQDLKIENQRLNEVHCKSLWNDRDHVGISNRQTTREESIAIPSRKSNNIKSVPMNREAVREDAPKDESKSKIRNHDDAIIEDSEDFETSYVLHQQRELAVSRTTFSAMLSLLVGMIVWKAEDPCMPLVIALFYVVGMSLWSVVQFFSTIKNKPASDAVALLSFNWFILGTLTYPTLPMLTPMLTPLVWTLSGRTVKLLGF